MAPETRYSIDPQYYRKLKQDISFPGMKKDKPSPLTRRRRKAYRGRDWERASLVGGGGTAAELIDDIGFHDWELGDISEDLWEDTIGGEDFEGEFGPYSATVATLASFTPAGAGGEGPRLTARPRTPTTMLPPPGPLDTSSPSPSELVEIFGEARQGLGVAKKGLQLLETEVSPSARPPESEAAFQAQRAGERSLELGDVADVSMPEVPELPSVGDIALPTGLGSIESIMTAGFGPSVFDPSRFAGALGSGAALGAGLAAPLESAAFAGSLIDPTLSFPAALRAPAEGVTNIASSSAGATGGAGGGAMGALGPALQVIPYITSALAIGQIAASNMTDEQKATQSAIQAAAVVLAPFTGGLSMVAAAPISALVSHLFGPPELTHEQREAIETGEIGGRVGDFLWRLDQAQTPEEVARLSQEYNQNIRQVSADDLRRMVADPSQVARLEAFGGVRADLLNPMNNAIRAMLDKKVAMWRAEGKLAPLLEVVNRQGAPVNMYQLLGALQDPRFHDRPIDQQYIAELSAAAQGRPGSRPAAEQAAPMASALRGLLSSARVGSRLPEARDVTDQSGRVKQILQAAAGMGPEVFDATLDRLGQLTGFSRDTLMLTLAGGIPWETGAYGKGSLDPFYAMVPSGSRYARPAAAAPAVAPTPIAGIDPRLLAQRKGQY